jgi:hypothetical protein
VLAQQRAEQRARAAAAARAQAERGRQQEMGLADLLAAMPDDVRADALAQLNDSDLAQLPPQVSLFSVVIGKAPAGFRLSVAYAVPFKTCFLLMV